MENETDNEIEYGIPGVEKTLKEITNRLLKLGYDIYFKIQKKEEVTPGDLEEQRLLEKQQALFAKAVANMKKAAGTANSNPLLGLQESLHRIESSLPHIKQSLNNDQ